MNRFWQYLGKEPRGAALLVLNFVFYAALALFFAHYLLNSHKEFAGWNFPGYKTILWCFYAALFEEALFRAAPLYLVFVFKDRMRKHYKACLVIALVLPSVFFGSVHFAYFFMHRFIASIIVLGLLFGLAYLKFGGYNGRVFKPFAVCVILHWLCNYSVVLCYT